MTARDINISLKSDCAEVKIGNIIKTVSLKDLKECFDKSMGGEATIVDPIIMPRNVISFGKNLTTMQLNTYWPGAVHEVKYTPNPSKKYVIPFPNIIIHFALKLNNSGTYSVSAKYFCTPLKPGDLFKTTGFITGPNPAERIFHMALPNVYDNCNACFGGNIMPNGLGSDLRGLDWYYLFLMNSAFNSDLHIPSGNIRHTTDYMNFLNGKTEYPYKDIFNV